MRHEGDADPRDPDRVTAGTRGSTRLTVGIGGLTLLITVVAALLFCRQVARTDADLLAPASLLLLTVLGALTLSLAVRHERRIRADRAERERLVQRLQEAADRERNSIVRHLHDGVVQDLSAVGYLLDGLGRAAERVDDPDGIRLGMASATDAVRDAVRSLRDLMVLLHPPATSPDALPEAIEAFAERLRATGADVVVSARPCMGLDAQRVALVHRATGEALQNVAKHAGAEHVWITLRSDAVDVVLEVDDDGHGPSRRDTAGRGNGHLGLSLLQDSASGLGGSLHVTERETGGTRLRLRLPSQDTADARRQALAARSSGRAGR